MESRGYWGGGSQQSLWGFPQGENGRGCWCPGGVGLSLPDAPSPAFPPLPPPGGLCPLAQSEHPRQGFFTQMGTSISPGGPPTTRAPQWWGRQARHKGKRRVVLGW